jgi:WD40 repeat protein
MLEIPVEANGTAIAFNHDGTRLIAANKNGTISMWDISMLAARLSYIEFPEYVHEARFTPSGEFLIVNSDDYHIWKIPGDSVDNVKKGSEGTSIFTATTLTYNTAISPDSKWVAAVEYDSVDAQSNRGRLASLGGETQYPLDHGGRVTGVAFDKDSKYAITTGSNGLISFWDVTSGKQNEEFKLDNTKPAFSLTTDPVDSLIAVGLRDGIKIWDYQSQQQMTELNQTGDVVALVFSKDGKWLASASEGNIALWKVESRAFTEVSKLQLEGKPQTLAFNPDSTILAGGSSSGFTYLWNTSTSEEIARIPHSDPVTSVSFSLDGSQLFTVSRKVVRIWDVKSIRVIPRQQLIPFACSHLVSNLSQSAWTFFFGDEKYRLICPDLPAQELLGLTNH